MGIFDGLKKQEKKSALQGYKDELKEIEKHNNLAKKWAEKMTPDECQKAPAIVCVLETDVKKDGHTLQMMNMGSALDIAHLIKHAEENLFEQLEAHGMDTTALEEHMRKKLDHEDPLKKKRSIVS